MTLATARLSISPSGTGAAEVKADTLRAEGKTAMFVAVDGALVGIVAVADPIKDSTGQAIKKLHAQGLRVIMATGDNERTAQAVAGKLGIDEVRAGITLLGGDLMGIVRARTGIDLYCHTVHAYLLDLMHKAFPIGGRGPPH